MKQNALTLAALEAYRADPNDRTAAAFLACVEQYCCYLLRRLRLLSHVTNDEGLQELRIAMLTAAKTWDPARGPWKSHLARHSLWLAQHEVDGHRRGARDQTAGLRKLKAARREHPSASYDELRTLANVQFYYEDLRTLLYASHESLQSVAPDGQLSLASMITDPDAALPDADAIAAIQRDALHAALSAIPTREARIVRGVIFEEMTLKALGTEFGVTRERARQLYLKGLQRLRKSPILAQHWAEL